MDDIWKWSDDIDILSNNQTIHRCEEIDILFKLKKEIDILIFEIYKTEIFDLDKSIELEKYIEQSSSVNKQSTLCFMLFLSFIKHLELTASDLIKITNYKIKMDNINTENEK